ncbi:hypothetical protein H310_11569 [Aphanomyces invadans]|uniref:Xaa-Pro aminopeptidase n=1 Tax=Aphanomyces invadans TaxID=157072 RepID=A0A024TLP0_9STRA|nr:hypothetical protein H310_11569 [Aphanomyces invadans]ETV94923.1 hypothetical protein H310_11569 [Aphanomyces invadans]|eukprot:XP_008876514.1 hypothetical protein H310_11569 [Aphanomyces invadans]
MSPTLDKIRRAFGGIAPRVLDKELRIQASDAPARVAALLIESEDAHGSEYVSARDKRRAFVSGFDGSAGTALITHDQAYLWTDGRYFLQAESQLSKEWTLMRQLQKDVPTVEEWVEANLKAGDALAIDPLLTSVATARRLVESASKAKASIVCCEWGQNVVDQVWGADQPPRVPSDLQVLGDHFTGASIATKLQNVRADLDKKKATAIVLTALDDIAWMFNVRGSDVEFNPVVISYALVTLSSATLFVDAKELTPEVLAHFGSDVQVKPYDSIIAELEAYAAGTPDATILVDPAQCNVAIFSAIPLALRKESPSIVLRQKAFKNPVEIQGMKNAHLRDGVAQVKFFSWLEEAIAAGEVISEVAADKKQQEFRQQMEHYKSLSFGTISGSGPNGAIIHYHATDEAKCGRITTDQVYLNDSGAQYLDGTTDVTRTVHLGQPTAHEIHCFTHVLKAHIALATAVFPNEIEGVKLDAITRAPLWKVGLDYRHGTGHGVGSFLNVHEKGVLMSFKLNPTGLLIAENMIVSNEPGYYEDGAFGIRIESLMVVVEAPTVVNSAYGKFCTFETITMIPIQRKFIDASVLTRDEIAWVDAYHAEVRAKLSPLLQDAPSALAYLERETRPLEQQ